MQPLRVCTVFSALPFHACMFPGTLGPNFNLYLHVRSRNVKTSRLLWSWRSIRNLRLYMHGSGLCGFWTKTNTIHKATSVPPFSASDVLRHAICHMPGIRVGAAARPTAAGASLGAVGMAAPAASPRSLTYCHTHYFISIRALDRCMDTDGTYARASWQIRLSGARVDLSSTWTCPFFEFSRA